MTRRLIKIYGDSLSLPRTTTGISYQQIYAELLRRCALQRDTMDIYNRSRGGADIATLYSDYLNDSSYFGPTHENDILILQIGIVDCAPRPLPRILRGLVGRLPDALRIPLIRVIHNNRARIQNLGLVFRRTNASKFQRIYREWLKAALDEQGRVICLNIAPTHHVTEMHSPGLFSSIITYNSIIRDVIQEFPPGKIHHVDVYSALQTRALEVGLAALVDAADGHHLTALGHEVYCSAILTSEPFTEPIDKGILETNKKSNS